jgi:cyclophilin family peptidyl-prolyl cis-trans isomerase
MTTKRHSNYSKKKNLKKKRSNLLPILAIVGVVAVIVVIIILVTNPAKAPLPTPVSPDSSEVPVLVGTKQYSAAPPMLIDASKKFTATFKMAKGGEFVVELYADKAPITVNSFVFLARQGFFDGVTFHRVLEGFMAQGGDPLGTGMGGPGYEFVNEDSDLTFDKAGVVAMANAGRDTNGSQFFITFGPTPNLNGDYTIFGQVISGMDVVNSITLRDPDQRPDFTGDVIESVTITEE